MPNFDAILKTQYEQVGTNFRAVWDLYLKFYTVFMTLNFTALGIAIQYINKDQRSPLVYAFILQNALGAMTAIGVALYSRRAADQQKAIINLGIEATAYSQELKAHLALGTPIPRTLTVWAGVANALSHLLFIACWIASFTIELKTPPSGNARPTSAPPVSVPRP